MGIVWLIEEPDLPDAISGDLCANFPVRTIASIETMGKILKYEAQFLPNLIVLRCPSKLGSRNAINMIRLYTQVPILVLSDTDPFKISLEEKVMILPKTDAASDPATMFSVIRRLIRRDINTVGSRAYKYKHISLDKASHLLESECGAISERIPTKEAGILQVLIESQGQCVSRETIVTRIWQQVKVGPRTVDAHISRLRRRLENAGVKIENIYGNGYILS